MEVNVSVMGTQDSVQFLIDTGAEVTVLSAADSLSVLGGAVLGIDFVRDPRRLQLQGIGGGAQHVVRDATMTLRSIEGERYSVAMPILIAEPDLSRLADPLTPQLPSLLGRDFLRRFHLNLACGDPRSVALETL